VWAGNDLSGNITVINPATSTVATTISGGSGTAAQLAAPLGIAVTKAG
jgi:YVTN family beta-propeller protein